MTMEKVPRKILETAVNLRDSLRNVYLALYEMGKPSTASEVAEKVGAARAYINMRLNQLVDMGLVKRTKQGRKIYFEVKQNAR